jgi:hypothetical protein
MPNKTYYVPNRTQRRYFKMCDAARVAREVVAHNDDTPEEVLACIARGLGFTHISLSRTRVVESNIATIPSRLPALITSIILLIQSLVKRYGWLAPILKKLLDIKKAWDDIADFLKVKDPPSAKVEEVFGSKCKCKKEVSSTPLLLKAITKKTE